MQMIHRHAILRALVAQQEVVEFVEFFVGQWLVELHGLALYILDWRATVYALALTIAK
jgi:hypothetical protein